MVTTVNESENVTVAAISVNSEINQIDEGKLPIWRKRRYHIVVMIFLSLFCLLTLRLILSVAIVAMTQKVLITLDNGTVIEQQEFNWNSKEQGLVLSCFFYGYIASQMISGFLSSHYGGHLVLGIGLLGTSVISFFAFFLPLLADLHLGLFVAARIVQGFFGGGCFTAIIAILAKWAPLNEKTFLMNVAFAGFCVGHIAPMLLSGIIIVAWGWRVLFYIFGAIGCICYVCWIFVVKANPNVDPYITETEKIYILSSIGDNKAQKISHPWKDIFTSLAVWAAVVGHFTSMWGNFTLQTQLPKYLSDVFNFNLDTTGILAAIPYIVLACLISFTGYFADYLRTRGYLTTGQVRRYFTGITYFIQMFLMLLVAFSTNHVLTIFYLTLMMGIEAFPWAGYAINALDLAPSHAAIIKGIGMTIGGFGGILSPLLSGYIVTDKSREQWQIVFFITSGIFLFGSIFSCLFMRGSVQPWAKLDLEKMKKRDENHERDKITRL